MTKSQNKGTQCDVIQSVRHKKCIGLLITIILIVYTSSTLALNNTSNALVETNYPWT